VKHIKHLSDDVPVAPFLLDRRRTPDRRVIWRGGRRDSDWTNRPPDGWQRLLTPARRPAKLRAVLSSLQVW
jgi:hypothetical protein